MGDITDFKFSSDDPVWKVLPAALDKQKINKDDWRNYAMFICYDSAGNRIESCLGYNEKSFLVFQKLKEAKKNPVFTFKHINDISSPIAVAQQKHAARKANTPQDSASTPSSSTQDNKNSQSGRTISRPSTDENVPRTSPLVGENEGSARGAAQAREMASGVTDATPLKTTARQSFNSALYLRSLRV